MIVRRELPSDVDPIRAVVTAAFRTAGAPDAVPVEAPLVDQLRADRAWLPALSLVAVDASDGTVVGHVACTRAHVDHHRALGLGPLAVRPDRQGRGIGQALMHGVLAAADALDETLVGLLGSPGYYARFGFAAASEFGVSAPDPAWEAAFQLRTLTAFTPVTGTFRYAAPFERL